jgi:hypothetical protein
VHRETLERAQLQRAPGAGVGRGAPMCFLIVKMIIYQYIKIEGKKKFIVMYIKKIRIKNRRNMRNKAIFVCFFLCFLTHPHESQ